MRLRARRPKYGVAPGGTVAAMLVLGADLDGPELNLIRGLVVRAAESQQLWAMYGACSRPGCDQLVPQQPLPEVLNRFCGGVNAGPACRTRFAGR
jgi:hypothetical protein